jgi:hypothetical protein
MTKIKVAAVGVALTVPMWLPAIAQALGDSYGKG